MLSAAAQKIEPARPQRRPWRKLAGASAVAAAASAAVAAARRRKTAGAPGPADEAETGDAMTAGDPRNGQAMPASDAD
jgi:negative regulator of sigma E activity